MRINFKDKDYSYTLISKIMDKNTTAIRITLEGEEMTLIRQQNGNWGTQDDSIGNDRELILAIGKNIALRYRL